MLMTRIWRNTRAATALYVTYRPSLPTRPPLPRPPLRFAPGPSANVNTLCQPSASVTVSSFHVTFSASSQPRPAPRSARASTSKATTAATAATRSAPAANSSKKRRKSHSDIRRPQAVAGSSSHSTRAKNTRTSRNR